MATDKQVSALSAQLDKVLSKPVSELVQNQAAWGAINFEQARVPLETVVGLANHLQVLPVEILPGATIESFTAVFAQVAGLVDQINQFSVTAGDPSGTRNSIVQQAQGIADSTLTTVQSWIAFLAYQRGDVQKNIEDLNGAVVKAKAMLSQAETDTKKASLDIESIIRAAREASASAGVGVFTSDFAAQSSVFETQATTWLKWTMGLAAATLVLSIVSFWFPLHSDATAAQIIQYLTSKVVVLGVLLAATVWCGRIYRAIKHQASTNNHRANALKTFQAFIKATDDEGTRNAVLLETTRSIFAHGTTGYLDGSDAGADQGSKVLEMVKASAKTS